MGTVNASVIIVGGGPAGLASAACLLRKGISYILLEKSSTVGSSWANRYDRLHLHSPKDLSGLPYMKMPRHYPAYVSKDEYAAYLDHYARAKDISIEFNQEVISIRRKENQWEVSTATHNYRADHLIMATGHARKPISPSWKGMENYKGVILHSSAYCNGESFRNKKVLIAGFGNSACEIAICLHEHGALPSLSVRNGVNVIPRDLAGISIIRIAGAQQWLTRLSPGLADRLNKPILRLVNGDLRKLGLMPLPYGPFSQILHHKKIPLLDIGTLKLIREGKIRVFTGIESFTAEGVRFTDGREEYFDAVILATGYEPAISDFFNLPIDISAIDPHTCRHQLPGLYLCGFQVSATGMLHAISREAKRIAADIAVNERKEKEII